MLFMEKNLLWYSTGGQSLVRFFSISSCDIRARHHSNQSADDNRPYSVNKTNDLVIKEIDHVSEVLLECFDFNHMK